MSDFYGPSPFWTNGSLYPQVNSNYYGGNPYPSHDADPGVNLTILPNDLLQLSFAAGNGNLSLALPVLLMVLNPNATQVTVQCSYPLSGQYDRLQRFLFYGTLIVALLFRRNGLIALAAIGVAMTYSALAAVHLLVLLTWYGWGDPLGENTTYHWDSNSSKLYGDIDLFGILPVLTATAVMLTPLICWSSTIRSHEARVVMVYWAFLIFAAMVPAIYLWINSHSWELNIIESFAYCTGTGDKCSWSNLENNMSMDSYNQCQCTDFCSLLSPAAPLRAGTNMVAYIGLSISERVVNNRINAIAKTYDFIFIIWIFALVQGALSLLSIQSSPIQVRNAIFKIFNADRAAIVGFFFRGERRRRILQRSHIRNATTGRNVTTFRKMQLYFAKLSATTYLVITVLGAIVYPAVFIVTIVLNELVVDRYPVSEQSDAVGAWSPFVGAGLVIIASLILRLNTTFVGKLSHAFNWTLNFLRYAPEDRPKNQLTKRQRVSRTGHDVLGFWATLSDHMWYVVRLRVWSIRTQLKLFGEWWKDPENLSDPIRWANVIHADLQQWPDNPTWTQVRDYWWAMEPGRPKRRYQNCSGNNAMTRVEIYAETEMQDTSGAGESLTKGPQGEEVRVNGNEI